eukprot:gene15957-biopygen13114
MGMAGLGWRGFRLEWDPSLRTKPSACRARAPPSRPATHAEAAERTQKQAKQAKRSRRRILRKQGELHKPGTLSHTLGDAAQRYLGAGDVALLGAAAARSMYNGKGPRPVISLVALDFCAEEEI